MGQPEPLPAVGGGVKADAHSWETGGSVVFLQPFGHRNYNLTLIL